MNSLQIDTLRDFAIDHLPRARADRDKASKYGSSPADFYNVLATTAVMVRSKPTTTATEYSAANILETVAMLHAERVEELSKSDRIKLMARLAADAKELSMLSGKSFPWLDLIPSMPEPEDEPTAPAIQKPPLFIAGRFLTTKEAAQVLGRAEQTLRDWASKQSGPIRPYKVGGRLSWSGDEILSIMQHK